MQRLVVELARKCRDAMGNWNRTGQPCVLFLALAVGIALVLLVLARG